MLRLSKNHPDIFWKVKNLKITIKGTLQGIYVKLICLSFGCRLGSLDMAWAPHIKIAQMSGVPNSK